MDERLQKALEFSNYMITLNNQKRILQEQYQNDLLYYFNGGQFTASQQLISFCQALLALKQVEAILVDDNNIPVEVEDMAEFTTKIMNTYFLASNRFLSEYTKLKTNRSVEGIVTG